MYFDQSNESVICYLQGVATELALIDLNEEMIEAEVKDLQGAAEYYPGCLIYGGSSNFFLKLC